MGLEGKNAAVQFFWEEYLSFQGGDLQPLANYKTTILQIHKAPTPHVPPPSLKTKGPCDPSIPSVVLSPLVICCCLIPYVSQPRPAPPDLYSFKLGFSSCISSSSLACPCALLSHSARTLRPICSRVSSSAIAL